jgi:hypothetical protein
LGLVRRAALAATLVALPAPALAGMLLGVRAGVGFPGGDGVPGTKVTDLVALDIPVTLDLGLAFEKQVMVGAYVRFAPAALSTQLREACGAIAASCGAFDVAAGGQLQWRLPQGDFEPWIGAGIGYEALVVGTPVGAAKANVFYLGWEVPISLGVDFRTTSRFTVGAYGQLTVGRFERLRVDSGGTTTVTDVADAKAHQWIEVGVRGAFDLF